MAHQLGQLFGHLFNRSDSSLFDLVGRASIATGRDFRKASDLLLLASGRIRQCLAMEKGWHRGNGKPQFRR